MKGQTVTLLSACIGCVFIVAARGDPAAFDRGKFVDLKTPAPSLDSPQCIRVPEEKNLDPADEILGVVRNGESCAYPLRMMSVHRIVNDHLGGPEILMTFCPESSTGGAFDPKIDDKALEFDASGHYQGITCMTDRQSKSVWSTLSGEALTGVMQGKRLTRIPTIITTWQNWKSLHPDSYILSFDTPHRKQYEIKYISGTTELPYDLERTLPRPDTRLPAHTLILGAIVGDEARAYPLSALRQARGVIVDQLGGQPIVLLMDELAGGAEAFDIRLKDLVLNFTSSASRAPKLFMDKETQSSWTVEGRAIAGRLKDSSLPPVNCVQTEWYAWVATHPKTGLHGLRPKR